MNKAIRSLKVFMAAIAVIIVLCIFSSCSSENDEPSQVEKQVYSITQGEFQQKAEKKIWALESCTYIRGDGSIDEDMMVFPGGHDIYFNIADDQMEEYFYYSYYGLVKCGLVYAFDETTGCVTTTFLGNDLNEFGETKFRIESVTDDELILSCEWGLWCDLPEGELNENGGRRDLNSYTRLIYRPADETEIEKMDAALDFYEIISNKNR